MAQDRATGTFFVLGMCTLILSPTAQAAKTFGPQWESVLLGVPTVLTATGVVFMTMALVCWLTRGRKP